MTHTHQAVTREMDWRYIHNVMPSYEKWIAEWCSHLAGLPDTVMVPPEATAITTPLHARAWQALLAEHPDKPLVTFFISGITQGFRIGFHSLSPHKGTWVGHFRALE